MDILPLQDTYKMLSTGMIFKNYKDLCIFLSQSIKNSDSKIAQIDQFELYFSYDRLGNKFIINEVYQTPLIDYTNSLYRQLIQKLILDMLVNNCNSEILLSTNQMLLTLHMTNDNYRLYKQDHELLSEVLNIPIEYIEDFYSNTDDKLIKAIDNALKDLQEKCLIKFDKPNIFCYENYELKVVDQDMKILLLNCQKTVLNQMGYNKPYHVRRAKKWTIYNNRIVALINEELDKLGQPNILYFFTAYIITVGKFIEEEQIKIEQSLFSHRTEVLTLLNNEVVNRHKDSYNDRHNKAVAIFGTDYDNIRVSTDYIDNGHKLIDHTIKVDQVGDNS